MDTYLRIFLPLRYYVNVINFSDFRKFCDFGGFEWTILCPLFHKRFVRLSLHSFRLPHHFLLMPNNPAKSLKVLFFILLWPSLPDNGNELI